MTEVNLLSSQYFHNDLFKWSKPLVWSWVSETKKWLRCGRSVRWPTVLDTAKLSCKCGSRKFLFSLAVSKLYNVQLGGPHTATESAKFSMVRRSDRTADIVFLARHWWRTTFSILIIILVIKTIPDNCLKNLNKTRFKHIKGLKEHLFIRTQTHNLTVVLWLDKGDYPENLQIVCLCPNK